MFETDMKSVCASGTKVDVLVQHIQLLLSLLAGHCGLSYLPDLLCSFFSADHYSVGSDGRGIFCFHLFVDSVIFIKPIHVFLLCVPKNVGRCFRDG